MMQDTGNPYKIISLLGMAAILAIAWGMDQFLAYQSKLASATFNCVQYSYVQYRGLSADCGLVLTALCLAWPGWP